MPDGMHEFLWFVLGSFSYRIVSGILQHVQLLELFELQLYHMLKMLHILSEDLDKSFEIKYSIMKDTNLSDAKIKEIRETDGKLFRVWREI